MCVCIHGFLASGPCFIVDRERFWPIFQIYTTLAGHIMVIYEMLPWMSVCICVVLGCNVCVWKWVEEGQSRCRHSFTLVEKHQERRAVRINGLIRQRIAINGSRLHTPSQHMQYGGIWNLNQEYMKEDPEANIWAQQGWEWGMEKALQWGTS